MPGNYRTIGGYRLSLSNAHAIQHCNMCNNNLIYLNFTDDQYLCLYIIPQYWTYKYSFLISIQ